MRPAPRYAQDGPAAHILPSRRGTLVNPTQHEAQARAPPCPHRHFLPITSSSLKRGHSRVHLASGHDRRLRAAQAHMHATNLLGLAVSYSDTSA